MGQPRTGASAAPPSNINSPLSPMLIYLVVSKTERGCNNNGATIKFPTVPHHNAISGVLQKLRHQLPHLAFIGSEHHLKGGPRKASLPGPGIPTASQGWQMLTLGGLHNLAIMLHNWQLQARRQKQRCTLAGSFCSSFAFNFPL